VKLLSFSSQPTISPQTPQVQRQRSLRVLVALGVLATGAVLSSTYFLSRPQTENLPAISAETLSFNGYVRGNTIDVVAIVPGQVKWVAVHAGDEVEQGQVVIQLNSQELQTQLETVQAQLAAAEQHRQQVIAEREVLREQLWEAYLKLYPEERTLDPYVKNADQDIATVESQLAEARADLQRLRSASGNSDTNADRASQTQHRGTFRQQQQIDRLESKVHGLENQLRLARGAWVRALSTGLSPYIHSPELDALRAQWVQVLDKLNDAEEAIFQVARKQHEIEARLDRLTVTSPLSGIVTDRLVEPADSVSAGKPLLSVADPNSLYLEAYVAEEAHNDVEVGESARVFLDINPGQPLNTYVTSIDRSFSAPQADNNLTDDQSDVLIQLRIENHNGAIMPNQAVNGRIVLSN